jgi:drug/metabolite transporter (DMT)-like permease
LSVLRRAAGQDFALVRLVMGAAMISFSGVFVKLVSAGPTTSAFYRTLFGGVILCLWLVVRRKQILTTGPVLYWLLAAGLIFAIDLFAWHKSILYVGVGLSTLLGNFQVFVMAAAGVLFFRERLDRSYLLAIPLAVTGLYLIVGLTWNDLATTSKLGVTLGLLTAVVYAGFMLCLRQARRIAPERHPVADLCIASLTAAGFLIPFALVSGESLAITTYSDFGWMLAYALVGQVFGWLFIASALPHLPTTQIGLALLLQPVLAYVWDVVIFDRQLAGTEIVGAMIAMFAIYLGSRPRKT